MVTNDANAAALGEMLFGDAVGLENFIMITLGTGLGSGLVVNGDIVYGHDGFAGELGHVRAVDNGRQCGCGKRGCLETYVSATGIKRTVFELLAEENVDSEFRKIPFSKLKPKLITALGRDRAIPLPSKPLKEPDSCWAEAWPIRWHISAPRRFSCSADWPRRENGSLIPPRKAWKNICFPSTGIRLILFLLPFSIKNIAVLGAAALIWKQLERPRQIELSLFFQDHGHIVIPVGPDVMVTGSSLHRFRL